MSRTAVIVIDMLNDFVTGPIASPRIHHIIEPIKDLCDYARKHDMPVIYSNDSHTEVDKEFKVWGPHAVEGTKGAEVIDELKPQPGDYIIPKKTYSGFFQTTLELVLRELDVDTVIITGWQADCLRRRILPRLQDHCPPRNDRHHHRGRISGRSRLHSGHLRRNDLRSCRHYEVIPFRAFSVTE